MKLYICGNGFDIHHSLKTRYRDYKEFLDAKYPYLSREYENFPELYEYDRPWNNIEESLNIDYEEMLDNAIQYYYPDVSSDSDSRWNDLDIDIEESTKFFYIFTGECFFEWIYSIDYSNAKKDVNLGLTTNDLYINFNYTDTIQKLYNVPDERVFHIHGAVNQVPTSILLSMDVFPSVPLECIDGIEPIVRRDTHNSNTIREYIQFGATGITPDSVYKELEKKYEDDDFYGVSIEPAVRTIKSIVEVTTKNVYQNYDRLENFVNCDDVDEVIIMGHSVSESDMPYYIDILCPKFRHCKWTAYCYGGEESDAVPNIRKLEKEAGIKITIKDW